MARRAPCKNHATCGNTVTIAGSRTGLCRKCYDAANNVVLNVSDFESDQQRREIRRDATELKKKYDAALSTIELQRKELDAYTQLYSQTLPITKLYPHEGSGTSEAVPVVCASDWHCEEIVTSGQVNGRNEFNQDIAERRIARFFQSSQTLITKHLNPGVNIHEIVVFLGGDFITNDIHEELVENVWCRPTEALLWVQSKLVSGIDFLLNHTDKQLTFVCRVGNHSRTTKKIHFTQENGHSLEHLLYSYLAGYYRNEPRVNFVIQEGYHIYLDVYGTTLRFHHGHAIRYSGGVGGITIPANKAIAAWNESRPASLDVFGHYHQTIVNRKFIVNGSLIGYNNFAVIGKFPYEPPLQSLFLVDKKRGVTCHWPIILEK